MSLHRWLTEWVFIVKRCQSCEHLPHSPAHWHPSKSCKSYSPSGHIVVSFLSSLCQTSLCTSPIEVGIYLRVSVRSIYWGENNSGRLTYSIQQETFKDQHKAFLTCIKRDDLDSIQISLCRYWRYAECHTLLNMGLFPLLYTKTTVCPLMLFMHQFIFSFSFSNHSANWRSVRVHSHVHTSFLARIVL